MSSLARLGRGELCARRSRRATAIRSLRVRVFFSETPVDLLLRVCSAEFDLVTRLATPEANDPPACFLRRGDQEFLPVKFPCLLHTREWRAYPR
jgi:hypothetical protein